MAKAKQFTFKRGQKATGLAAIGSPHADVDIKLNKKVVGQIDPPNYASKDGLWRVGFVIKAVATEKSPCNWKWVFLKKRFESEEAAREFVNTHFETITTTYDLASLED